MKKVLALMLVTALLLVWVPATESSRIEQSQAYAEALAEEGLLQGDGNGFALDRPATRVEAITLLVRLLGGENEALAANPSHPFDDVASWAAPYVGWALEQGYAKGISETQFGATNVIDAAQFLTLCLRVLGYTEGVDFIWDQPYTLAESVGLMAASEYPLADFLRADLVILSYRTLERARAFTEVDVVIPSQENYPLNGTLTMPKGEVKAALVLVHGSGPSDRDEHVAANYPFRDLAHGLANYGIATLRFDKVTYTYGMEISTSEAYPYFTLEEESIFDAANAVRFLKAQPCIPQESVFLLGHSLGSYAVASAGTLEPVAGYIILAGTPRPLWQISYDQNMLVIDALRAQGIEGIAAAAQNEVIVNGEVRKAEAMGALTDEQALTSTVFGISAYYLRSMSDPVVNLLADGRPVLVLHGGKDRQVTMTDYTIWQEGLAEHPDATFQLYENLNHIFGDYQGEPLPFLQIMEEYAQRTPVPDNVISDIAAWLLARI